MKISQVIDGEVKVSIADSVEFDEHFDVIVSGVGTAGAVAVLACADEGLSVLGIESFTCLGGTTTIGGITTHYFGISGGLYEKYDNEINEYADGVVHSRIEGKKIKNELMAVDRGVRLIYESSVCGVYIEGEKVIGVMAVTPQGIKNYSCLVLMDCTGDGTTANMAGCASMWGRDLDGETQPYSMVSAQETADLDFRTSNRDFGRVDQRDDKALSDALIFSRSYEMPEERENNEFLYHMPLIGVREGRRFVCEETVKLTDIFNGEFTKTPAFYSYADLDKHGRDIAFDGELLGDWSVGANLGAFNMVIPVSFKALIPKGIDGILTACRSLGVDRDISSCVRMVPDMKKIGEAAAYIASLAKKHGCALKDIPYDELKEKLEKTGCLGENYGCRVRIAGVRDKDGNNLPHTDVSWIKEPEMLEKYLKTDKPGIAIWSAKKMGLKKAEKALMECYNSDDENLRRGAAFALSICGSRAALPLIRKMIEERDSFLCMDCRKCNQRRSAMATYYAGRLADEGSCGILIDIITNKEEYKREEYSKGDKLTTVYTITGFNNALFQQLSEAAMALIRIGDAHENLREKISRAFKDGFEDESYISHVTTRPSMSSEYKMTKSIKTISLNAVKRWKNK